METINKTSAKEYLESQGINLNGTTLITYIDGYLRQPDLCKLLEDYHLFKLNELNNQSEKSK